MLRCGHASKPEQGETFWLINILERVCDIMQTCWKESARKDYFDSSSDT